ncbi:hypothetical protein B0H13DRAFT_1978033, partial [Mycena leptocephala]
MSLAITVPRRQQTGRSSSYLTYDLATLDLCLLSHNMPELNVIAIPLEIVELSCLLQWVPRSRLHLFRTVTLENMHSVATLVELLESPLSTLARAIHRLSVSAGLQFNEDQEENYIRRLRKICNVESLRFGSGYGALNLKLSNSPWSCFTSVQFLTLSFGAVVASASDLLTFIASFPMLRELEMDGLYWDKWPVEQPVEERRQSTPPAHLIAVRLRYCAVDVILDGLLPESSHSLPSCTSLTLGGISDCQMISVSRYLKACGPTLQHLSLTLQLSSH